MWQKIEDPTKTTFSSLPENYEAVAIQNLNNDLLSADYKKEKLTARIKERRASFFFSLTREEESGLKADQLAKALEAIKEDDDPSKSKV